MTTEPDPDPESLPDSGVEATEIAAGVAPEEAPPVADELEEPTACEACGNDRMQLEKVDCIAVVPVLAEGAGGEEVCRAPVWMCMSCADTPMVHRCALHLESVAGAAEGEEPEVEFTVQIALLADDVPCDCSPDPKCEKCEGKGTVPGSLIDVEDMTPDDKVTALRAILTAAVHLLKCPPDRVVLEAAHMNREACRQGRLMLAQARQVTQDPRWLGAQLDKLRGEVPAGTRQEPSRNSRRGKGGRRRKR